MTLDLHFAMIDTSKGINQREKERGIDMRVGYIRVSTVEQHEDRQVKDLTENAKVSKVFMDKLSGKDTNRPQLNAMLDYVREGDTVVVSEYSRLARSTKDLLNIIDTLENKGVTVISMKEKLDTSTPNGEFMLTVLAGVATLERKLMLQRQREGIAIAKANGKYKGRQSKQKPDDWESLKAMYMSRQITVSEIAKRCDVSRPIVYKWLKETPAGTPEET